MKKQSNNSRINNLILDVLEYAFTEWLVRQGVFRAFKANYEAVISPSRSFRDALRSHILRSLCSSSVAPADLISSAFLFTSTPEGANFWCEASAAWARFCAIFQSRL